MPVLVWKDYHDFHLAFWAYFHKMKAGKHSADHTPGADCSSTSTELHDVKEVKILKCLFIFKTYYFI
jgi:hypothetical protein